MNTPYCHINGIKIYAFKSREELINFTSDKNAMLIAINAEKILHGKKSILELTQNNIGYPDGMGAVWALKNHGFKDVIKIPGCELWLDIIKQQYKNKSFYLIGSTQKVIEQTVFKLRIEYPGINILNFRNGYLESENDKNELISDIKLWKPDIVFVATGSPHQELLMKEIQECHPALYMGLGGSYEVYTGKLRRAPKFWIRYNLEWFYRLLSEPSRIKRQIHLIRFIYYNTFRLI